MDLSKRRQNEKDFGDWEEVNGGGRIYWFEVKGRKGGLARYVKTVDRNENTIEFRQEIFDKRKNLIEIHEKFPIDKGHKKV